MKNLVFAAISATLFVFASPATAEESPLLPVEWDGELAEPWSPPAPSAPGQFQTVRPVEKATSYSDTVKSCQEFKIRWSESSARKLFRALRYNDHELEEVDLQPWIDVAVMSQRHPEPFSVHPQSNGRSVGVVPLDAAWTRSYVVAQTVNGPVVASQEWPSPRELDDGATCRPVASRIEFPDDRVVNVAIEPFRMWGMRVADSLPEKSIDRSTYEVLVGVIRTGERASASR